MKNLIAPLCLTALVSACSVSDMNSQTADSPMSETILIEDKSFEAVEANILEALEKRDLKLFTVVNHGEGAKSAGMDIGQSKLFIFGNPKTGTPLMMANREMGLELPMKILIYTTQTGELGLRRTDIKSLGPKYGLTNQDERIEKIEAALKSISQEAISTPQ